MAPAHAAALGLESLKYPLLDLARCMRRSVCPCIGLHRILRQRLNVADSLCMATQGALERCLPALLLAPGSITCRGVSSAESSTAGSSAESSTTRAVLRAVQSEQR
jgi:hypothetical protein